MPKELNKGGDINLGRNKTHISLDWPEFKKYIDATYKRLQIQFVEKTEKYIVFATENDIVYTCVLIKNVDDFDETFTDQSKKDAHNSQRTDFENNFKAKGNKPVIPLNAEGNPTVVSEPRTGNELVLVTHNFCDPTTWYSKSVRVTGQALTDDGTGLTWSAPHDNFIDMTHGKLFDEDALAADVAHGYSIKVYVNAVEKTARAPFATTGGDYTVDYKLGKITFASSQAGQTVTADYSYENGSEWLLIPDAGKRIDIEAAEVQFSTDVIINDSIEFDAWVYDINNLPNKMLYERTTYKRMANYIDEARGAYPQIPAIGGTSRGTQNNIYGFPFRYEMIKAIKASEGTELRVRLKSEQVFGGEHATASFYCNVRNE